MRAHLFALLLPTTAAWSAPFETLLRVTPDPFESPELGANPGIVDPHKAHGASILSIPAVGEENAERLRVRGGVGADSPVPPSLRVRRNTAGAAAAFVTNFGDVQASVIGTQLRHRFASSLDMPDEGRSIAALRMQETETWIRARAAAQLISLLSFGIEARGRDTRADLEEDLANGAPTASGARTQLRGLAWGMHFGTRHLGIALSTSPKLQGTLVTDSRQVEVSGFGYDEAQLHFGMPELFRVSIGTLVCDDGLDVIDEGSGGITQPGEGAISLDLFYFRPVRASRIVAAGGELVGRELSLRVGLTSEVSRLDYDGAFPSRDLPRQNAEAPSRAVSAGLVFKRVTESVEVGARFEESLREHAIGPYALEMQRERLAVFGRYARFL